MKTKVAATAFFLTLVLTSFLGIYQINSAENQARQREQQAMIKASETPTTLITAPQALP